MIRSFDARKIPKITVILTFAVAVSNEEKILRRAVKDADIQSYVPYYYRIPKCTVLVSQANRPVIVGFGPAGMFAALVLAKAGLHPIVLERGKCVEQRQEDVTNFRKTGVLCTESNVQFGEGGAGTFSDGKLTTGIKDPRIRFVLQSFVECGAPEEILYLAKPHIGTDKLVHVVREMRKTIQRYGGEILFQAHMEKLTQKKGKLTAVQYQKDGKTTEILTSYCILAVGHSARDVFEMLYNANISMMQKNFAVGMRIEHSQDWLNHAMYGREASPPELPVADYKLAVHLPNKHSLYTFCMCPGGEVVAASSERHRLVVNGMSNYARNGRNANSALLVQINDSDYGNELFASLKYQEELERKAFLMGQDYKACVQLAKDYLAHRVSKQFESVLPTYSIGTTFCDLNDLFSKEVNLALHEALEHFEKKVPGFVSSGAILSAVESRSSSSVRLVRDKESYISNIQGIYPSGEGSGYAGGIMTSAIDGIRSAEHLIEYFAKGDF